MDERLVVLIALSIAVLAALRVRAWWRSALARRRAERARAGERSARALLMALGFEVLAEQAPGTLTLSVDGARSDHAVRADYLVARAGKRFVAEVKTGALAPSLDHAPTRRQILEYCAAFDVEGALLVDAESGRVREIALPWRAPRSSIRVGIALGLGVLLGLAVASLR